MTKFLLHAAKSRPMHLCTGRPEIHLSVNHYLPSAALVPAMRPQVKHIMMEVPEAGYSW